MEKGWLGRKLADSEEATMTRNGQGPTAVNGEVGGEEGRGGGR